MNPAQVVAESLMEEITKRAKENERLKQRILTLEGELKVTKELLDEYAAYSNKAKKI